MAKELLKGEESSLRSQTSSSNGKGWPAICDGRGAEKEKRQGKNVSYEIGKENSVSRRECSRICGEALSTFRGEVTTTLWIEVSWKRAT